MKGRSVIIDHASGRTAAALVVNGRLQDLLFDPVDDAPRPGAIFRAVADRPVKGAGGMLLRLGGGARGLLKAGKGVTPGQKMLVQISTRPEEGKAATVTTRLLFKSRYAIVTPGAPGLNVARSIRGEDERERLQEVAFEAMRGKDSTGLILRTACENVDGPVIAADIADMLDRCAAALNAAGGQGPALVQQAPSASQLAWRDWVEPEPDEVVQQDGSFDSHGVWDLIEDLRTPHVPLSPHAHMAVEVTRALVAVDVNTGGDFSHSAGLKANLAAAKDLPRQLRLRGLGGQIVIDFAPMRKNDRRTIENALRAALKGDGVDTTLVGWTPLGHLELQRKRERAPLDQLLTNL